MPGDRDFFKIWAAKALLSDDLDCLSDHERTIWLFGLCVSSLEKDRWCTEINERLAKKCKTTPAKLAAALNKMADLGMCELSGGMVYFATAKALNEETERRRRPSDDPEKVRQRVQRHRDSKANSEDVTTRVTTRVTTPVTRYTKTSNAAHKEEEKEEEEEVGRYTPDDGRDIGFSERLGTLTTRFGGNINPGLFREFELIAEDFTQEQIVAALDSLSRKQPSKRPYPGAIRAEIEPPKAKSLDDPFAAMVVKGYDQ